MAEEMTEREKLIQALMDCGMTRQDAAFAADIELGVLPTGDVIVVPESDEQ